uniref:Uncharacterized protein n=1 Tax=Nelumbo nucifera TaxID=4432 RepID=A0A822XQ94_NELNU|nr:TPA_asm: hypothetical protein HUJ06_022569 [Nelumbo nucifera]
MSELRQRNGRDRFSSQTTIVDIEFDPIGSDGAPLAGFQSSEYQQPVFGEQLSNRGS